MTPSIPTALRQEPRRYPRSRTAVVRALGAAARLLGGRGRYRRRHLRAGRFRVRRERLAVPGLAPALEGLRCVQLSDVHAGPFLGSGDLAEVVEAANGCRPDLVFLTGDLIARQWEDVLGVVDDLARLSARLGVLGVFGNHDYHGRQEGRIAEAFGARGIDWLRNSGRRFEVDGAAVVVTGLEDLEEGREVDPERARENLRPGDLELVLCHNPAGGPHLVRRGCAAVFSGHSHGGQIDLPWIRRHTPAHPGLRLRLGPTTLFVSRGLGTVGLPVRVGAPTEILVVDLVSEAA